VDRAQFDAQEIQSFPDSGEVFLITGQTIKRFDQDQVELPIPRSVHEPHYAVSSVDRRS
jgi:hypothetical protein